MALGTPNTSRRSARARSHIVKNEAKATVASQVPSTRTPRRGPNHDSYESTIQMLLKLPGFDFSNTAWVFPYLQKDLSILVGASYELEGHKKPVPAKSQRIVAHRVADVIEACIDEWLDNWQEGPVLSEFWDAATERLRCKLRYWERLSPTPVQVYKICMRYTAAWDPNGRGYTKEQEQWGFKLGELTWGPVKADIDPDLFAKPWDYQRA